MDFQGISLYLPTLIVLVALIIPFFYDDNRYSLLSFPISLIYFDFDPMPLVIAASIIGVAVFFAWAVVRYPVRMVKP